MAFRGTRTSGAQYRQACRRTATNPRACLGVGAETYTTLSDGTYVVGTDIQPGIYKTAGPGSSGVLNSCYWAVLKSLNTLDIADNGNIPGPTTIQVDGKALELNGGCTWARIG